MNNPHLLLTRAPRAYCKFRSEFFCFCSFFSALIRGANAKPIVWSWFLIGTYRERNHAHSPQSFQRPSIHLSRRWFNDHHISKKKINKKVGCLCHCATLRINESEKLKNVTWSPVQMVYGQVARMSSRPKSCRPKPESCCPKFIVVSLEILSHVARSFIECLNLKKSNILSKSQGINS